MLGSIVAPAFIKRFGLRKMLAGGSILFTLVVISQILPALYQQQIASPGIYSDQWFAPIIHK
jgi:hypothetical protein